MNTIRPIETEWNGCLFRSRLEARWAVFLTALGVRWDYEPEGFVLEGGARYLPDFRVRCHGTRGERDMEPFDLYIEVKGRMAEDDADKVRQFGYRVGDYGLLVVGGIPDEGCETDADALGAYEGMDGSDVLPFNYETVDGDCFAAFPAAHRGRFYLMGDDSNYINLDDMPLVRRAYRSARQARFEHGEKPAVL